MTEFTFTWNREGCTRINEVDVDWDEDCQVTVELIGSYRPAKLYGPPEDCYPAEYPELDVTLVTDSAGNDITDTLTDNQIESLCDKAWDVYEAIKEGQADDSDAKYEAWAQRKLDEE